MRALLLFMNMAMGASNIFIVISYNCIFAHILFTGSNIDFDFKQSKTYIYELSMNTINILEKVTIYLS